MERKRKEKEEGGRCRWREKEMKHEKTTAFPCYFFFFLEHKVTSYVTSSGEQMQSKCFHDTSAIDPNVDTSHSSVKTFSPYLRLFFPSFYRRCFLPPLSFSQLQGSRRRSY